MRRVEFWRQQLYAVDQVLHNPDKIKRHLLKATEDTLSLEALAPMINMLSLTASAAVDREAIVDFDKNSGNVFGLARHEGGGAEVSARGKRAVEKRLAQNSTKSIKDKVELEWAKALKAPSSDNGMKTHFAKRMVQQLKEDNAKQMKKDHQQIVVSEETILDWMMRWGGTLNKVARPKKPRRAAKS